MESVSTSNPKSVVCGPLEEQKFFALKAGQRLRKNAVITARDKQGNERVLNVHVCDDAGDPFSLGLSQTPRFPDRKGQRRKAIFRRFSTIVFQILAVIMVLGGLLAQMQERGPLDGALYTVELIAEGMALIVGLSLALFLLIALFTYFERRHR